MNCFLFQLQFNTPVHFGGADSALSLYSSENHFRADTLFSALCHTALNLFGMQGLSKLVDMAKSGALLLSDSMPWTEDIFYLPKPCYTPQTERELPADKRKAMKRLAWIPLSQINWYCEAVRTGVLFDGEALSFGEESEHTKAMVPETGDALPYSVGVFHFRNNCGLYFLAALDEEQNVDWLTELVTALGLSGIGGKVSAGYGKFQVISVQNLHHISQSPWEQLSVFADNQSSRSLLLTTSLPRSEELESALAEASFQLVRRAGFIASNDAAAAKKQTQYYLSAGSVVKNRFTGDIYDVGQGAKHPVWRYAKPIFLGVKL